MSGDDVDILQDEVVHDGYARVRRLRLRHRRHAGGRSRALVRELVERGHAVAVLPYDPARDEVVLVRQFRIGAWGAGYDPWLVEIVAGIVEAGETAEDVARRETLEETGCTVDELVPVCTCLASPGILSETIAIFCGRTDSRAAGGIHGVAAEGEDIESFARPWDAVAAALGAGRFADSKTVIALQWLALNREALRKDFRPPAGGV